MLNIQKNSGFAGILFCLFAGILAGCSGGGSGDDAAPLSVDQLRTLAVTASVTFPASSPLDSSNASVMNNGDFVPLDSDNHADIDIFTSKVMDVTILLPSRDGVEPPTVYLNTTVVPGEAEVNLSVEETAVSLVLTGVDHRYLADPMTASYVKSIVKKHSTAFIEDLTQKLEQDPYLLRPDTIANVLGPLFSQAVADSDAEINASIAPDSQTAFVVSPAEVRHASALPADAEVAHEENFGDFIIKYDRSPPFKGFAFAPPSTYWNKKLTFLNGSMLPVLTRITDLSDNTVMKEIPGTTMEQAFSPAILTPTSGPFGLPLPNWEVIENGTRNIQVEVFTPGLNDIADSHYSDAGSPCSSLLARASFSGAIMPVIGVVLPSFPQGVENAAGEVIFGVLQRADVFDKISFHWTRGEFKEGLAGVYNDITANWGFNSNIASQIVEELGTRGFLKSAIGLELVAKLGVKAATAKIAVASAGLSVAAMTQGLVNTPSKITYHLVYPVGLHDLQPRSMRKITEDADNNQEFTLTGHGLSAVRFDRKTQTARLFLEAYDRDHEKISDAWLDEGFGFEIESCGSGCSGDTITFKLPDEMVGADKDTAYVRLTVDHVYISSGWLSGYTDWFDYLEAVKLPASESTRRKFTIHLTQDVRITSIEPEVLEKGGRIVITGEGFAGDDSAVENEVYFIDNSNQPISASIAGSTETVISAYLPSDLTLNDSAEPVTQHIGGSSLYVELSDGSRSNEAWVAVIPDPVTFSPEPVSGEMTYKDTEISLHQINFIPIYYTVNDSAERTYSGPITITETCTIKAYAKVVVDGVIYASRETSATYITCQEGETFVPYPHGAQCQVIQNQDLMPRRYCPLDESDYSGTITTSFGSATCSYSWLTGGNTELAREVHINMAGTTAIESTSYWAQPKGRPSYVWRPGGVSYNFCPDGSFAIAGQSCGH